MNRGRIVQIKVSVGILLNLVVAFFLIEFGVMIIARAMKFSGQGGRHCLIRWLT